MTGPLLYFSFLLSPFLTLPWVVDLIALGKKNGYIMFSILLGLIGYMYKPAISDDLYRYYEWFDTIRNMGEFSEVLLYTQSRTDFGLFFFQYLIGTLGGEFQIYVMIVTILNTSLLFYVVRKVINKGKISKGTNLLLFVFLLSTISLNWIIGASRYFTAISFVVFSYYVGIVEKKRLGDIIIFFAPFFHFSTIAFLIIYFVSKYVTMPRLILRIVFIISLGFYFIPKDLNQKVISTTLLQSELIGENYEKKVENYTLEEDFNEKGRKLLNYAGLVMYYITSKLPLVLILLFTLFSGFKFDKFYYLVFTLVNVTSAFETVSGRFRYLLTILFSFWLIVHIYKLKRLDNFVNVFIPLKIFASIYALLKLFPQLIDIFFDTSILSTITILSKQVNFNF